VNGRTREESEQERARIERVSSVFNPQTAPHAQVFLRSIEATQKSSTTTTVAMPVHDGAELEHAITDFASTPNGGLVVLADSFTINNRKSIISLAAKYRVPAI
jgi:hypothetical protein